MSHPHRQQNDVQASKPSVPLVALGMPAAQERDFTKDNPEAVLATRTLGSLELDTNENETHQRRRRHLDKTVVPFKKLTIIVSIHSNEIQLYYSYIRLESSSHLSLPGSLVRGYGMSRPGHSWWPGKSLATELQPIGTTNLLSSLYTAPLGTVFRSHLPASESERACKKLSSSPAWCFNRA